MTAENRSDSAAFPPPIDLGPPAEAVPEGTDLREDVVRRVREKIMQRLSRFPHIAGVEHELSASVGGKMLRTRLAARLLSASADENVVAAVVLACAATELVHTASLFHDDVIDGSSLRRGHPTLWRGIGANAAVLTGDVLFCEAMEVIHETDGAGAAAVFVAKVKEVCLSEVGQELVLRGTTLDVEQCLTVARSKTGPLFAFTAMVCGAGDPALREALEQAGYEIGTAYQLADDLLDESGSEAGVGKTLGTDRLRRKYTLAHAGDNAAGTIVDHIGRLCRSALERLSPWPSARSGLLAYIVRDFCPAASLTVR